MSPRQDFQDALISMMRRDRGGWGRMEQLLSNTRRPRGPSAGSMCIHTPRPTSPKNGAYAAKFEESEAT